MSCHWKTVENVLEILLSCALQKQHFFHGGCEKMTLTKSPWTCLLFWFHLFPFCCVLQPPRCGLLELERWVAIYVHFWEKKEVNNYGHCKKILLSSACWGKTTNLKTVLTILSSSQWSSLYVYVIMGRDYTPSFLCHICPLNKSGISFLYAALLQYIFR